MRYSVAIFTFFVSSALSFPHFATIGNLHPKPELSSRQNSNTDGTLKSNHFTWDAPGSGDVRSPCPALNTLANHGFLPHNGRNITLQTLTTALKDGINFGADIATTTFNGGVRANPDANAGFFDLDMLHIHNLVEHDGSLSRKDSALDISNKFDAKTFDSYLAYYDSASELTVEAAANARARHVLDMSKKHADFSIAQNQVTILLGETAMMLWLWNQGTQGTLENPVANRTYFEYFFRNERLPVELGWSPIATEFATPALISIIGKIQAASPAGVPLTFSPVTPQ